MELDIPVTPVLGVYPVSFLKIILDLLYRHQFYLVLLNVQGIQHNLTEGSALPKGGRLRGVTFAPLHSVVSVAKSHINIKDAWLCARPRI